MEEQTQPQPQSDQQVPSSPTPVKPSNKPLIATSVLVFILMAGGLVYLGYQNYQLRQQLDRVQQSISPSLSPSSQTGITPSSTPDAVPQVNSVYLGKYSGGDALFVTNTRLRKHYEGGVEKTADTIGVLEQIDGTGRQPFDYTDLENPRKILILNSSEDLLGISNFTFSAQRDTLYVVLDFVSPSSSYPDVTQKAYQINLASLENKEVWSHIIGDDKYPKKGPAGINEIADNKYLVLWLGICYACEGFDPHGSLLLNIETGQEKYLGEVDNFNFNLSGKTVTYQNLAPFEEACEPSPGCTEGKRTVYKPAGQTLSASLP